MQTIPCVYHPTTAVLIDDDIDFLNSLAAVLSPHYRTQAFSSPQAAIQCIEKNQSHSQQGLPSYVEEQDKAMLYTPPRLYSRVYDSRRFEQIAVLIVDQNMPEINGL